MNLLCKIFGHKTDTITWFDFKRCPTGRCDRCDAYFRLSDKKLKEDSYNTLLEVLKRETERSSEPTIEEMTNELKQSYNEWLNVKNNADSEYLRNVAEDRLLHIKSMFKKTEIIL